MISPLKLCEEWLLIWSICYRLGSTIVLKSGQLGGNVDTFKPIFSSDALDFLVTDIFLEKGIITFSSNVNTRTNLTINFDLVKCITKNKYT